MQFEVGSVLEGKITGITKFGAFVELPGGKTGMIHISEVASTYVKEITDHIKLGDVVKAKVLSVDETGKIRLSIKRAIPQKEPGKEGAPRFQKRDGYEPNGRRGDGMSFEDMMSKFKQRSDEKMSDIKRNTESKRGSGPPKRGGGAK